MLICKTNGNGFKPPTFGALFMKKITGTLSAIALALVASAALIAPTTASAGCWSGCDNGYSDSAGFEFGAGGIVSNEGVARGDWTGSLSASTKEVYGGGDAASNTLYGGQSRADAYAGAHFTTMGASGAMSAGNNHSSTMTSETGSLRGGGFAATTRDWTYGPNSN
jgi:hypothetical protein